MTKGTKSVPIKIHGYTLGRNTEYFGPQYSTVCLKVKLIAAAMKVGAKIKQTSCTTNVEKLHGFKFMTM